MARRLVRPPRSKFKVGDLVVCECDFIQNATGVVIEAHGAINLVDPFPEYQNIVAPGVAIRVTKNNGDHEIGDELNFHDTYVRLAA